MTRVYCARRLLAIEPISFTEFVDVTGWTVRQCRKTLAYLHELGELKSEGRGVYSIESAA
jgi:hypothetical protein